MKKDIDKRRKKQAEERSKKPKRVPDHLPPSNSSNNSDNNNNTKYIHLEDMTSQDRVNVIYKLLDHPSVLETLYHHVFPIPKEGEGGVGQRKPIRLRPPAIEEEAEEASGGKASSARVSSNMIVDSSKDDSRSQESTPLALK